MARLHKHLGSRLGGSVWICRVENALFLTWHLFCRPRVSSIKHESKIFRDGREEKAHLCVVTAFAVHLVSAHVYEAPELPIRACSFQEDMRPIHVGEREVQTDPETVVDVRLRRERSARTSDGDYHFEITFRIEDGMPPNLCSEVHDGVYVLRPQHVSKEVDRRDVTPDKLNERQKNISDVPWLSQGRKAQLVVDTQ